jgi:23S rRNA (cytidine1920-2'-O)/16S rRNA (cytidine1409-2'-O)-methyltransferase
MARQRIDHLLVEKGLFETRSLARAAIEAGLVKADGQVVDKPSRQVDRAAMLAAESPYTTVSRAGEKLRAGLDASPFDPAGMVALDLGASTGGFTDLLLQRGAHRVYAVDVGHGQLHPRLAADSRVHNLEGLDARALTEAEIPETVDLLVADLAFIGLAKAIPAGLARLKAQGGLIALIKPQFEAGPGAGKNGVIRDPTIHARVVADVQADLTALGIAVMAVIPSPIAGGDGNQEFLLIGRKAA